MNVTINVTDAANFLESLQRPELAMLVRQCEAALEEFEEDNGFYKEIVERVVIRAAEPIKEALDSLPPADRKRLAEAVTSSHSSSKAPEDIHVEAANAPAIGGIPGFLAELLIHREMMISVATGGSRIQDVDDYYRAREARLRQDLPTDITYNNPHANLWDWYQHWRSNFPQYKERRHYVRQLFGPAIDAISRRPSSQPVKRDPTGWERVDRALVKARTQLDTAAAEEDCQAIGLLCREVIISLAQAVYDPAIHESQDGVTPSTTDANRMLEAYVAHVFPGDSYKEVRAHARASLALALNLQHRRTATRQLAALCVEATSSTTAVISIIARATFSYR